MKYISRLSSELKEYMALIVEGYFSQQEYLEIEDCIKYFELWIWNDIWHDHGAESEGWCIRKETVREIMANDEPPEEVTENMDLNLMLLMAESLKKGFDNVLLYARFLKLICLNFNEETGESRLKDMDEQHNIKKWLNMKWRFEKRGIYIMETDSTCTDRW